MKLQYITKGFRCCWKTSEKFTNREIAPERRHSNRLQILLVPMLRCHHQIGWLRMHVGYLKQWGMGITRKNTPGYDLLERFQEKQGWTHLTPSKPSKIKIQGFVGRYKFIFHCSGRVFDMSLLHKTSFFKNTVTAFGHQNPWKMKVSCPQEKGVRSPKNKGRELPWWRWCLPPHLVETLVISESGH